MDLPLTLRRLVGDDFAARRYLLAISGGADSVALAVLFTERLAPTQLTLAHFNHRTRGRESDEDARFVQRLGKKLGCPVVSGVRTSPGASNEANLREERYHFLETAREQGGFDFVVTAHHLDDDLETFFMRLCRGTGLDGLSGIPEKRGRILRPLLGTNKTALVEVVENARLSFRTDSSNLSHRYYRNEIRHKLIPLVKDLGQRHGSSEQILNRWRELLAELKESRRALNQVTEEKFSSLSAITPFWTRLDWEKMKRESPFEQSRILRRALKSVSSLVPSRLALESSLADLSAGVSRLTLEGDLELSLSCGWLFVRSLAQREKLIDFRERSRRDSSVTLRELGIELTGAHEGMIRFFNNGDTYEGKKLKYYLLEKRIPRWERMLLPLFSKKESNQVTHIFPDIPQNLELRECRFPFSFSPIVAIVFALSLLVKQAQALVPPAPCVADQQMIGANVAYHKQLIGLALDLGKSEDPKKNFLVSPVALQMGLGLLVPGASGTTQSKLTHFLSADKISSEDLVKRLKAVSGALQCGDANVSSRVTLATKLFRQTGMPPLLPPFTESLAENFRSEIVDVNFSQDAKGAAETINQWVSEATSAKIKDLANAADFNSQTKLYLANALHTKARWYRPFNPKHTKAEIFHVNAFSTLRVPMMHLKIEHDPVLYAERNGWQWMEMPSQDEKISFVVGLPKKIEGLGKKFALTANDVVAAMGALSQRPMIITMPKFLLNYKQDFSERLKAMGLDEIFGAQANFQNIDGGGMGMFVGQVGQKVFLDVNEEGLEGAAATEIIMTVRGLLPTATPVKFEMTHPFFFMVLERTSRIPLFVGWVRNPLEKPKS